MQTRRAGADCNIWSAASSTGQEPYTIAMTLREHFPQSRGGTLSASSAPTCHEEVLDKARAGPLRQIEVNRGLPAPMLVKYFDQHGAGVGGEARRGTPQVEFRSMNLAEPFPALPRMDIVFLRNVLIYFDADTKREILGSRRVMLAPDGYLFLGAAETTLGVDESFIRVPLGKASAYRLAG